MADQYIGDNMSIIILSAKLVQADGISGVKLSYLYATELEPTQEDGNNKGMSALECWIPDPRIWMKIEQVPARYTGKFKLAVVKNKPQLTLYDVNYSNEIRLVDKSAYDLIAEGVPVKPEDFPFHPDAPVEPAEPTGKKGK